MARLNVYVTKHPTNVRLQTLKQDIHCVKWELG